MKTWHIRLLAVGIWLAAVICAIPYLALQDDYADYRDGTRFPGTVTSVEPYGTAGRHLEVFVADGSGAQVMHRYPKVEDRAAWPVGGRVDLIRSVHGGSILASELGDKRPPFALVPGAVLLVLLGAYVFDAPRRRARRRAARRDPLDALLEGVARTRDLLYGTAAFMLVGGGFMAFAAYAGREECSQGELIAVLALAGLSIGCAGFVLARALRHRDLRQSPLIRQIVEHPEDIAWVYVLATQTRAGQLRNVCIHKADGKELDRIRLIPEDEHAIVAELQRRAPHAARGYSKELEAQYTADPTRWRPAQTPTSARA